MIKKKEGNIINSISNKNNLNLRLDLLLLFIIIL